MNILVYEPNDVYLKKCTNLIENYLQKLQQEAHILVEETIETVFSRIENENADIDLIYLSVESTEDLQHVEVIRNLGYQKELILYSHQKDFAVDGYDNDVLNYIVKDESPQEKFELALDKAFQKYTSRQKEGVVLSCAGESEYILLENIRYFESRARIMTVYYEKDKAFEFYTTMGKLEEQFYQKNFIRIHRSFFVNKRFIAQVFATRVVLTTGEKLPVGRSYKKNFEEKDENN